MCRQAALILKVLVKIPCMTNLHSSKTWHTRMSSGTLLTCFYLVSRLLIEMDAAPVDSLNIKEYTTVNGEKLTCLKRDKANACPLDHDIAACETNLTLVTCKPCEIEKGYRLCMQIYSDVDYVKCYKPECTEEEEVVIDVDEYGRCTHADCRCKASEGYVKGDLECVRLKQKCAVNFSVIDGMCRACPDGTHKQTVGFEPCSPLPMSTTQPSETLTRSATVEVAKSTVTISGNSTDTLRSRSQGATTPGSNSIGVERDKASTSDRTNLLSLIIIPCTVVCIVVVALIVVKRSKRGIRLDCRYCCLCYRISNHYHQADSSEPTELGERTGAGPDHEEERLSSPPTYQSSDNQATRRVRHISDSGSTRSHGDSNMDPEFINPNEPSEQDNPTDSHLPSWPTLLTNGGSSLLQDMRPANNSSNRGLHDLDNNQEVEGPVEVIAAAAAAADPADPADPDVADVAAPALAIADALAVSDLGAPAPVPVPVPALSLPAPVPAPASSPVPAPQSSAAPASDPNAPSSVAEGFPEITDSLRICDFGSDFSNIDEF